MSVTKRVQRWREAKRQHGLKGVMVWLTEQEEMRLKDLALQQHCSPSAIVQQALAQFTPRTMPGISNDTDIAQLRQLIREELAAMLPLQAPVTDTVTVADTATPPKEAPAWKNGETTPPPVQADTDDQGAPPVQDPTDSHVANSHKAMPQEEAPRTSEHAGLADGDLVSGSDGDLVTVTVTEDSNVTDIEAPAAFLLETAPPEWRPGRPSTRRQRILDLLTAHPKGLTEEQLTAELRARQTIGPLLAAMVSEHVLAQRGRGRTVRYRVA